MYEIKRVDGIGLKLHHKETVMKKILCLLFLIAENGILWSQVKLFTPPVDYPYANDFKVTVNNQESFVYENRVAAYTYFEANGEVCPANWRAGSRTIKPTVQESKAFFNAEYGKK